MKESTQDMPREAEKVIPPQEMEKEITSEALAPGREYYRGLVVNFCREFDRAILFMSDGKDWDPAETLEEHKDIIKSDIVLQCLQFCVDRFNRMADNGEPNDFERGKSVAQLVAHIVNWDTFIMESMKEDVAIELLQISDNMDIESLSPREAFECAIICNMAGRNKLFESKLKLSMTLLEYAAKHEDCYAMYQMAMISSSKEDYENAKKWFLRAAEQGMVIAQYAMGNIYYYGKGVEIDYPEAMKWYALAAEQGQPQAQCNLGACYYYGQGTNVDYDKAFMWYAKSAEQGEPNALYNLGTCYMNGQGIEADTTKAIDCYSKAAELGHPGAEAKITLYAAMLKGSNNSD